ncbi:hypothetical protein BU16DRAFT_562669 [Lophium mytilinum]|uniref:F-box domain-containing protein n=1 Tax=Lophium mytilinum TaxID=390894 RepID=A0A6A6QN91_9PEZI|nr:hypothetical protein BU16DRAFT_562669 [Lophium mytilinum]
MSILTHALEPPPEPPEATTSTESRLLSLPTELVRFICGCLDLNSVGSLRQTCKELCIQSNSVFQANYPQAIQLVMTYQNLACLVNLSMDSKLSNRIKYVSFACRAIDRGYVQQLLDPDCNPVKRGVIDQDFQLFYLLLIHQNEMRANGKDVDMLGAAFRNFKNLEAVQISSLPLEKPEDISPNASKTTSLQKHWEHRKLYAPSTIAELGGGYGGGDYHSRYLPREMFTGGILSGILTSKSLYPAHEVIARALKISNISSINVDVSMVLPNLIYHVHDPWDARNSRSWNPTNVAWGNIVQSHLRSLSIRHEDTYESATRVLGLLESAGMHNHIEELQYSNSKSRFLGGWLQRESYDCLHRFPALVRLGISDSFVRAVQLLQFFSRCSATLESISMRDIHLNSLLTWREVFASMAQLPRLSSVFLESLTEDYGPAYHSMRGAHSRVLELHGVGISQSLQKMTQTHIASPFRREYRIFRDSLRTGHEPLWRILFMVE